MDRYDPYTDSFLRDTQYNILGTNLAEVGTDCISRQAALDAIRPLQTYKLFEGDDMILVDKAEVQTELMMLPTAQPYTIHSDGRLWVTVDDIDKVNAVVVDESKSKFCKQFYMDAQPEIILCKDCKHRDPEDKKCDCGHDIQWQLPRQDDWFCADAERREATT